MPVYGPTDPRTQKKSMNIRRKAVIMAACYAYYHGKGWSSGGIPYAHNGAGLPPKHQGPPPNVPEVLDCSWFAYWCYLCAGMKLPGTWTGPQWDHGQSISFNSLRPADLCFYGQPDVPGAASHVTVYIGNNKVLSMGGDGGPFLEIVKYRSDMAGYRRYLPVP